MSAHRAFIQAHDPSERALTCSLIVDDNGRRLPYKADGISQARMDKEIHFEAAGFVWAFDLGKASIGEAVRRGMDFPHVASLLMPAEFAETKSEAKRRRAYRTRLAHLERERSLDRLMREAGIEPLRRRNYDAAGKWSPGAPADPRLEREFPAKGDSTCHTSCLLRIRLLRGEKLEPWQVYKAFNSAIQRRGYDPDIPWKNRESRTKRSTDKDKESRETLQRMNEYQKGLAALAPDRPEFHFPSYYDAWRMGLWDPSNPLELKERIDCRAKRTRGQVVPRALVVAELRALVQGASAHYPLLAGVAERLMHGPAERAYASYYPELRKQFQLKEGGAGDWQGVLGQKIPRFDNRIINKCVLIPRLNVCKITTDSKGDFPPQSQLAAEVAMLMKLKNMRILRDGIPSFLSAPEISQIFQNPKFTKWKITQTQWKKLVCAPLGATPLPGHEEVEAPKSSGRSRFSRPALAILKRLILSGETPLEFHAREMEALNGNSDPRKGLVPGDLKFLTDMGDSWATIHIPNQALQSIRSNAKDSAEAIARLVAAQNDPIVRHRLGLFAERVAKLSGEFGEPESVVLEFVREDFMGEEARKEYLTFLKKRANERAEAKRDAAKAGATESSAPFKMELLKAQGGICPYTGKGLSCDELDQYEVDHIVPRSQGGPDATVNFVLTTKSANDEKHDRTPFEWLSSTPGWDAYVERVRGLQSTLRNKKVQLLISSDAKTLVEKYTALAETAWISKLAQAILDFHFGWTHGNDEAGRKRVVVVSGGLTARIRRKYGLNQILHPEVQDPEEAEKKNRKDDRHHALDAMVISFIPGWARDPEKRGFFRFPKGVDKTLFEREIKRVLPVNICLERATLTETLYGARGEGQSRMIVQRAEIKSLALKPAGPGKAIFDLSYAKKQLASTRDKVIARILSEFLQTGPSEGEWNQFCDSFQVPRKDGSPGPSVKRVSMRVGDPAEYREMSKDQTGAFRRGLKGHQGQFVYLDSEKKPRVRPVYAFESIAKVRKQLAEMERSISICGFFQSGCAVKLEQAVAHDKTPLKPGIYRLNTIRKDAMAVVTDSCGQKSEPISLARLLASGFAGAN